MFVCNSVTRWWSKRWKSKEVVSVPFICEKKITFFLSCVKYVFDFLRPPLPSFSGFFALFWWKSVEVICKPFPKSENFSPVYGCRPTADQIITACRPLMGVWIEIIIFSIPLCDVTPLWGCGFYSKNSRSDDTGRLFFML